MWQTCRRVFLPLRDDNPRTRFPVVTLLLIAANVVVFLFELSLNARGQKLLSLEAGAIPYEIVHHVDLRPREPAAGAGVDLDVDVPARRLDAPPREHVVPLGLRRQRRGGDGVVSLRDLLLSGGDRGRAGAVLQHARVDRADDRRLGRDRRRAGRLRDALPARADPDARDDPVPLAGRRRSRPGSSWVSGFSPSSRWGADRASRGWPTSAASWRGSAPCASWPTRAAALPPEHPSSTSRPRAARRGDAHDSALDTDGAASKIAAVFFRRISSAG